MRLSPVILCIGLFGCAPANQSNAGDETFAPSNTTQGVVPDGAPAQGSGSTITDGETSTRGAVNASDTPTAAPGLSGKTSRSQAN